VSADEASGAGNTRLARLEASWNGSGNGGDAAAGLGVSRTHFGLLALTREISVWRRCRERLQAGGLRGGKRKCPGL